jgi:hypothetical protein
MNTQIRFPLGLNTPIYSLNFFPNRGDQREVEGRSGGVQMGTFGAEASTSRCALGNGERIICGFGCVLRDACCGMRDAMQGIPKRRVAGLHK